MLQRKWQSFDFSSNLKIFIHGAHFFLSGNRLFIKLKDVYQRQGVNVMVIASGLGGGVRRSIALASI